VDLVQHPEATDAPIPDETIRMMVDRQVICSMLENGITGKQWADTQKRIQQRADSLKKADSTKKVDSVKAAAVPRGDTLRSYADSMLADILSRRPARAKTSAEIARDSSNVRTLLRRRNAERLIQAGCIVTASTDNYRGNAPEFSREPKPVYNDPGIGSIIAIEGLVELGMTPGQAIVAATRNGAIASRALDKYGTVEAGKSADLLLLAADPLADIHNIRRLAMVMKEGQIVDAHKLPLKPVFYRPVAKAEK
jgi:imidazolonepropionase-like amidohydrolase